MHLEHFALIVEDYDEAIAFFVDVLGFELVEDSAALTTHGGRPKRWVVVRPPGERTGLCSPRPTVRISARRWGTSSRAASGLFLRVDDFAAAYERPAGAAGVEFVGERRSEPYGKVAVFVDMAGNRRTCSVRPADGPRRGRGPCRGGEIRTVGCSG